MKRGKIGEVVFRIIGSIPSRGEKRGRKKEKMARTLIQFRQAAAKGKGKEGKKKKRRRVLLLPPVPTCRTKEKRRKKNPQTVSNKHSAGKLATGKRKEIARGGQNNVQATRLRSCEGFGGFFCFFFFWVFLWGPRIWHRPKMAPVKARLMAYHV